MAASLLALLLFAPGILSNWHSPPPIPASATASKYVTTSIEELRVGDWVLARNPEVSEEERDEAGAIVPEQWRRIALRMEKPDGTGLEIELLRPADWLEGGEARPGDWVWLDLAELGAEGEAEILAVGPCPALGPPPSPGCRVVTGTFAHQSAQVLDLSIEGLDLPLGVTANHPFWSEDRQEFLPAGELRPGERLLRADGFPARLLASTPRPTAQPVYNIEVDVEHVYYVSSEGLLVHNACTQDHHAVPWNNKRFNHQNHPLVARAKANLKTLSKNLRTVKNHKGRHSTSYHREVKRRLDNAYNSLKDNSQASAQKALDRVINGIWRDVRSGKLKLYDHKNVRL